MRVPGSRAKSQSMRSTAIWGIWVKRTTPTEANMAKMLILRGNSGPNYPDESGKPHNYAKGALHEQAALEYARRKGYQGTVLDISGDPDRGPGKTRATSP